MKDARDVMDAPKTEVYSLSEETLQRIGDEAESRMTPEQIHAAHIATQRILFGAVRGDN